MIKTIKNTDPEAPLYSVLYKGKPIKNITLLVYAVQK